MLAWVLMVAIQDDLSRTLDRLSSADIQARDDAERDLALLGDPAARELEKLLDHADADLASRARRALSMNRRRTGLPDSLCRRKPDVLTRDWPLAELLALELTDAELAFFAPRAARDLSLPPFTWFLVVRRRAGAVDLAAALRRAPDDLFKALALAALQEVDPSAASRLALPLLRSDNPSLRVQAAFTLGDSGPASAAGDLKKLLEDPDEFVRAAGALAIRKLVPDADIAAFKPACPLSRCDQLELFARLSFPQGIQKHLAWVDVVAVVTRLDPRLVATWKEGKLSFVRRSR